MTVKVCPIHGPLSQEQCYVYRPAGRAKDRIRCAVCDKAKAAIARSGNNKERHNARKRRLRAVNVERARAQAKATRRRRHDQIIAASRAYYRDNKDVFRRKNLEVKIKVFGHYAEGAPCCKVCGETELRFLCLDHIDGGGCAHRMSVSGSGSKMYRWAIRSGYPPIFQVLCHNCNARKEPPGHEKYRRVKERVISHYSGGKMECERCDETDLRVLTVDHIDGGGREHRKQCKGGSFYSFLERSGFPAGLRVLCHNHNLGRHTIGEDCLPSASRSSLPINPRP